MWSIALVKESLPALRVYHTPDRQTYLGTIAGRMLPYARVTLWREDRTPVATYEYSWKQIVSALNTEKPLIA